MCMHVYLCVYVSVPASFTCNHQTVPPPGYHGNCALFFFLLMYSVSLLSHYPSHSLLLTIYFHLYLWFLVFYFLLMFVQACVRLCVCFASTCLLNGGLDTLPDLQYDDHINSQSHYQWLMVRFNQWGKLADDV